MMEGDRGVGLVIMMMVMLVIVGLTGTVMSLATIQTAVAANYRRSLELLYAAEAALELVVQDLGCAGSWKHALHGRPPSRIWLTDVRVPMVDGVVLDLARVTVDLQRTRGDATASSPWCFVGHAQPNVVAPVGSWSEPQVVAVWLANDVRAIDVERPDDDPTQLVAYAAAFGSGLSHRAVQATVRRHVTGWVEVTSWRVAR